MQIKKEMYHLRCDDNTFSRFMDLHSKKKEKTLFFKRERESDAEIESEQDDQVKMEKIWMKENNGNIDYTPFVYT